MAKLMATKGNLGFTRVTVGTGAIPSGYDPASMIDLAQYKMDGKISKCEADGDVAKITMQISSVGIETGFTMTEMGVFAEDPDIGEILYAYLDMKEDPQYIYAEGGEAQKFMEVTLEVAIGTATKVTAIINPESMITREQFDEEMATKVTTAGGDIADTTVSAYTAVTEEYPEPKAGDTMTTIIGKVVKFIQDAKEGFCRKSELVDNCTSSDTDKPPTAKQAKVLWDKITAAVTALTTHKSSGDHDGRYYTESEINNLLAAKVSKSDLVNNATSAATDKAPTANQVKVLNDRINALNGEKSGKPVLQYGITVANNKVTLEKVAFFTMDKLCTISFEARITSTFSSGEILKLPSGMKAMNDNHFCFEFSGAAKHGWILNYGDTIYIQDGAEKTGTIRGNCIFLLA